MYFTTHFSQLHVEYRVKIKNPRLHYKFTMNLIAFVLLVTFTAVHVHAFELRMGLKLPTNLAKRRRPSNLPDFSQSSFPEVPEDGYDLVIFGSGPGGESVATQASKLGARVAIIEKKQMFGGPTGLSSKAVREATKRITSAIDQIGGDRRRQINGLWKRKFPALKTEAEAWQAQETRQRLSKAGYILQIHFVQIHFLLLCFHLLFLFLPLVLFVFLINFRSRLVHRGSKAYGRNEGSHTLRYTSVSTDRLYFFGYFTCCD